MTQQEVKQIITVMICTYPNFKPQNVVQMVEVWTSILKDYPYPVIDAALKAYITTDTSGFAPSCSQLVALTKKYQRGDMEAGEAWAMVRRAISKASYYADEEFAKLPQEVQRAVGSPYQLRVWAQDEEYNEGVISSVFKKNYNTVLTRSREESMIPQEVLDVLRGGLKQNDIEASDTRLIEGQAVDIG